VEAPLAEESLEQPFTFGWIIEVLDIERRKAETWIVLPQIAGWTQNTL
jgi:hypothetical protein